MAVTLTLDTVAPVPSVTVPRMLPAISCACAYDPAIIPNASKNDSFTKILMLFPFSFRHHVLDWVLLRTHGHVRCPDKISRRRNKHGTGYARRERGRQRFTSGSGFPILFSKPADTPLLHRLNIVMAVCTIGLLFRSAASRMAWPRNTSPKLA